MEGRVANLGTQTVKNIQASAILRAGDNTKVIARTQGPVGRMMNEEELVAISDESTRKAAYDTVAKETISMEVGPRKAGQFTLVLLGVPRGAENGYKLAVEVIDFDTGAGNP